MACKYINSGRFGFFTQSGRDRTNEYVKMLLFPDLVEESIIAATKNWIAGSSDNKSSCRSFANRFGLLTEVESSEPKKMGTLDKLDKGSKSTLLSRQI